MTIDALRGPVDRPRDMSPEPVAIGASDQNIFLCPSCTRPLAVGVSRCSGCGTRLVAGVPLLRVGGFVGLGLVAGHGRRRRVGRRCRCPEPSRRHPRRAAAGRRRALRSAGGQRRAGTGRAGRPDVPPSALSALRQTTVVNQRLLADADLLARALASDDPSAAEIAPLLRGLATNAAFGDRLVPAVASWDDGVAVSQGLAAFYAAIARVADEGLAASLTNERAYVDAGRKMLLVLGGLTDLDAASRGLAASADTELPPLIPAR